MLRVGEVKVRKYGYRGFAASLPKIWIDDRRLVPGDTLDVYRDQADNLVIAPRENREAGETPVGEPMREGA